MVDRRIDQLFDSVKNWGVWGPEDTRGTLNYIRPEHVREAASLVRSGRSISLSLPVNKVAGPDNPNPAIHYMATGHDTDIGSGTLRFATDFLGMQFHGDCHTHIDALCHIAYRGQLYNGRPAGLVTTTGADAFDITEYSQGVVGPACCSTFPASGECPGEPGMAVSRAELEEAERAQGVRLGEGDLFVFRTGHHRRRLELGPWDNGYTGQGKAGLHVDAISLLHERHVAGFLPDGDGETVPSTVEGIVYPTPFADHRHGDAGLRQLEPRGPGRSVRDRATLGIHGDRGTITHPPGHGLTVQPDRSDVTGGGANDKLHGAIWIEQA